MLDCRCRIKPDRTYPSRVNRSHLTLMLGLHLILGMSSHYKSKLDFYLQYLIMLILSTAFEHTELLLEHIAPLGFIKIKPRSPEKNRNPHCFTTILEQCENA